jgi:hypothetical protein
VLVTRSLSVMPSSSLNSWNRVGIVTIATSSLTGHPGRVRPMVSLERVERRWCQ